MSYNQMRNSVGHGSHNAQQLNTERALPTEPVGRAGDSVPSSSLKSGSQSQTKQIGLILEELQQNKKQVNQIMEWINMIKQKEEQEGPE